MKSILRRELAPITDEAWSFIDEQAVRILKGNLSARKVLGFGGPLGWSAYAVNLGGVTPAKSEPVKGATWGLRQVLPLLEVRVPFSLSLADLDTVARGGKTPEVGPVIQAAQKAALFEERAIYYGIDEAGIAGVLGASAHKPLTCPKDPNELARALEDAVHALQSRGVGGPFRLVLGRVAYQALLVGDDKGYPLTKRVRESLEGGDFLWSPAVSGAAVVSSRGGDYELTLGQDFSIGYTGQTGDRLDLYLVESFTSRVLEPTAAIELKSKA